MSMFNFEFDDIEDPADEGRMNDLVAMIEMQPYSSDAWMRRGILLNNLNRHDEALGAYDEALSINPADAETVINRGVTLDNLGRSEEALAAYEGALKLDPLSEEALFNRGITLERLDRLSEAITTFEQCIAVNAEHPEAWYELGMVSEQGMRNFRKYALIIILIVAGLLTPPDPISQILVAIPLLLLYELSIHITKVVERNRARDLAKALE